MKHRIAAASLVVALAFGYAIAGDLKSGPQVGDRIPGAFHPLNICNAEYPAAAGKKHCLV